MAKFEMCPESGRCLDSPLLQTLCRGSCLGQRSTGVSPVPAQMGGRSAPDSQISGGEGQPPWLEISPGRTVPDLHQQLHRVGPHSLIGLPRSSAAIRPAKAPCHPISRSSLRAPRGASAAGPASRGVDSVRAPPRKIRRPGSRAVLIDSWSTHRRGRPHPYPTGRARRSGHRTSCCEPRCERCAGSRRPTALWGAARPSWHRRRCAIGCSGESRITWAMQGDELALKLVCILEEASPGAVHGPLAQRTLQHRVRLWARSPSRRRRAAPNSVPAHRSGGLVVAETSLRTDCRGATSMPAKYRSTSDPSARNRPLGSVSEPRRPLARSGFPTESGRPDSHPSASPAPARRIHVQGRDDQ